MMAVGSDYWIAWLIYLLAVACAQWLCWRASLALASADLRLLLQFCLLALLLTPVRLEPTSQFWVPAFMAALMESLNEETDTVLNRLSPILINMLVLSIMAFSGKLLKLRHKHR
jgi:hypothetical protein